MVFFFIKENIEILDNNHYTDLAKEIITDIENSIINKMKIEKNIKMVNKLKVFIFLNNNKKKKRINHFLTFKKKIN